MALSIDGTGNGTIGNLSVTTATGNIVSSGDNGTITAGMLDGGQSGSAPAFAIRAWVSFDFVNSIFPVGSGNISSVVDTGTGRATVNLSTAMPDANYAVIVGNRTDSGATRNIVGGAYVNTSSQFYWVTETSDGAAIDQVWNYAAVIR